MNEKQAQFTISSNEKSIDSIQYQIMKKSSPEPFFATNRSVVNSITDMDHHPYTRWFRGVYYYPDPIVFEREAGWRPMHNSCYEVIQPVEREERNNLCFEAPCSTVFPCHAKIDTRYIDSSTINNRTNKECLVQYR